MDSSRLRVFVSSKMQELAPERLAIKSALDELKVDGWVFEADAGARPQTIRQTYREEVEKADLYIGLFWKGYGDYTIEEYEHARRLGKDCLVYEKRAGVEGQRDARLDEFLVGIGGVESGLTVKWFDTPEELRELVKQDVARWQTEIVRRYKVSGAPLVYRNPAPPETRTQKELAILMNKVEQFWVRGVLENSVHHQVFIELGKKRMAEAVEHPWETVLELPFESDVSLPGGGSIVEIFADADVGRYLLILGAPGSGKTTTLLELARDLIAQAREDRSQPVPTVFNLSSWGGKSESVSGWMVKELKAKYQIPDRTGRAWLDRHHILPLLDGLDEVSPGMQAACVGAINEFVQGYPSGLVVCSRLHEYASLPVRLKLNGAVCLQPLSPEQADAYLTKAGPELAALREALKEDENLRELTQTPLMLSIMSLAYEGQPLGTLAGAGLDTFEGRRHHVFDTYIERMFQRKGRSNLPYAKEQLTDWLRWLARKMRSHSQSIFLVEQLQPGWLSKTSQWVAYLFISRVLAGLLFGSAVGLPVAVIAYMEAYDRPLRTASYYWGVACACGLALGLVTWLINCIRTALVLKLKFISEGSPTRYLLLDLGLYLLPWTLLTTSAMLASRYDIDYRTMFFLFEGPAAGLVHWFIFESRRQRRDLGNDILTVETLRWSWGDAFKSGEWWTAAAFVITLIATYGVLRQTDIARREFLVRQHTFFAAELTRVDAEIARVPKGGVARLKKLEADRSLIVAAVEENRAEAEEAANSTVWETVRNNVGAFFGVSFLLSSIAGLIGFLLGGFKRGVAERKSAPNQGVMLSVRNAIRGGLIAALTIGLLDGAFAFYLNFDLNFMTALRYSLEAAMILGVPIGLIAAFRNGGYDVLKHYVLRFLLSYKGYTPRRFVSVLDHAAALILLQKVGGGYIFIHRLLLEHFASMEDAGREGADSNLGRAHHA